MYPGAHLATTPDKPAVVMAGSGATTTYAELDDRSARLTRVWHEAGLRRGDHVALLTDNHLRAYEVYWAAMRSGLYLTAINRHLSVGEAAYVVDDCQAQSVVVSAAVGQLAAEVLGRSPRVRLALAYGGEVEGCAPYDAALAAVAPGPLPDQPRGADMLYSSGTTGRPKGVQMPLPDRSVEEPGDTVTGLVRDLWGFGPDTVYLSPAPVYHAAPLRFGAAVHALGGTVVMLESFDAARALAAIEAHRVTHSQWVPTMFVRMLKLPVELRTGSDLSTHRVAVHAAAPCPVEVKRAMIEWWGPIVAEYYASTETNGMTVVDSPTWLDRPGTVGRPVLGTLHICADDGTELPVGEVGAVYFERDHVPFAYHGDPDKTRAAQHPAHPTWTTVGDLGYVDADGYLFLTDRKAFMIISGGVNIYPQEIEDVLALHPAVLDVAVIGVPDEEMGEQVKAVVQPAVAGSPDLERELIAHLRERLAHFKVPRTVDFVAELPRTPTGKLVKGRLRERYAAGPGPRA